MVGKVAHRRRLRLSSEVSAFAENVSRDHGSVSHYWPNPVHFREMN